jgi:hypothetical protein
MPGIYSGRVTLVEGNVDELVSIGHLAKDMHGFTIVFPPGEEAEWVLDMLWRITMVYAAKPSLLRRRATVRKMVEAVMSKESRKPKPARGPVHKSGLAGVTAAKTESPLAPSQRRKARTRKRN